jgi:hypothetical protein
MPLYQDGSFPSGSPVVSINGVLFKANSMSYDKSAEVVQITDENGNHSGALSYEGPTSGTVELQFANNSVAEPTTAAENSTRGVFQLPIGASYANVNVFATAVSIARPARGPWIATVSWQRRVN